MVRRHLPVRPGGVFTATLHLAQGQTPFDVADESVEDLLEELKQKQTNVRTSTSLLHITYKSIEKWQIDTSMSLCLLSMVQWRNEQSILDRQSQQGTTATNAQGKRRRLVLLRIYFLVFHLLPLFDS